MPFEKIAVLGLGNVGLLAAKLLHEGGFAVTGFDTRSPHAPLAFDTRGEDLASDQGIDAATIGHDAVLSRACAVIQLVRDEVLPQGGFLKQEAIPLEAFLATGTGRLFVA